MLGAALAEVISLLAILTFANATLIHRPVRFLSYANGLVNASNLTLNTPSSFECSLRCMEERICSAFSVSVLPTVDVSGTLQFECLITFGSFTWTPNENYSLFMEDIGPLNGYTLQADGKFYKFEKKPLWVNDARLSCMEEGGNLAVPYPTSVRAIMKDIGSNTAQEYYVGITLCSSKLPSDPIWCTDDGATFNSSNKGNDPRQAWRAQEPSGSGVQVTMDKNGTWNDINEGPEMSFPRMCRRFNYFTRSPSDRVFHKMHYEQLDAGSAASVCASEGGTLANGYGMENYLGALRGYRRQLKMMTYTSITFPPYVWVAGTDAATEGVWIFPDGSTWDISLGEAEPMNQYWTKALANSTTENCLILLAGGFDDADCKEKFPFLCEIRI